MSSPLASFTPEQSINLFNVCWQQWISSLQSQLPELHDGFENILNALSVAAQNDIDSPMFYFQSFTANLLDMLFQRDPLFFEELATLSERKGIPDNFSYYFEKMTPKAQDTVWVTLDSLTIWVSNVYPDYAKLVKDAKQRNEKVKQS